MGLIRCDRRPADDVPVPVNYDETRLLELGDAWTLLEHSEEWEVAERYLGGRVRLGRPRLRPPPGGSAVGVAIKGAAAQEGVHGLRVESPRGLAGASWVETEDQARSEFQKRLSDFAALTAGEERLFRLTLVIGGEAVLTELVAVGEVSPDPDVIDGYR